MSGKTRQRRLFPPMEVIEIYNIRLSLRITSLTFGCMSVHIFLCITMCILVFRQKWFIFGYTFSYAKKCKKIVKMFFGNFSKRDKGSNLWKSPSLKITKSRVGLPKWHYTSKWIPLWVLRSFWHRKITISFLWKVAKWSTLICMSKRMSIPILFFGLFLSIFLCIPACMNVYLCVCLVTCLVVCLRVK